MTKAPIELTRIVSGIGVAIALAIGGGPDTPRHVNAISCPDTVFLGDYPNDDHGWTDNVQGVAHDASNWFFTTQSDAFLIKFPITFDLTTEFDPEDSSTWPAGGLAVPMPAALENAGYEDFKELDQAKGFLFVGVNGEDPDTGEGIAGIAVFTTSDLTYLGVKSLTVGIDPPIGHVSIAAFNPVDARLYYSSTVVSDALRTLAVDFNLLANVEIAKALSPSADFLVTDGDGPIDPPLENMQGAAFTPWGDLYLVNGLENPPSADRGGVHLINPAGQLIAESTNGFGAFNYAYDPSATFPNVSEGEEPEGADWWNRDVDPASPGIGGQLHIIMLGNMEVDEDNLYLKHYVVDYSCIASGDADEDGLTNGDEIYNTGTGPKTADTDDDGLNDGLELNELGTNPLLPDSDADGEPDGDEDFDSDGLSNGDEVNVYGTDPTLSDTDNDGLSDGDEVLVHGSDPLDGDSDDDGLTDGDEVNVYGTDPTKADTDNDLLNDGLEVTYGTDPLVSDTDGDGLPDGLDVEFIENAVQALPSSAFRSPGNRNAIFSHMQAVESKLLAADVEKAVKKLNQLRTHLDGCGAEPDNNDWIRTCPEQIEVRDLVDLLIANLSA